jgi:hypothetical protein
VDSTGTGTGFIQAFKEGTGAQNLLLNPNGGNVGIGTGAPQYKLDVYSGNNPGLRLGPNDSFSNSLLLGGYNDSDHTQARIQTSNGTLLLDSKTDYSLRLNSLANGDVILAYGGGKVGIGTVAPAYKLDINSGNNTGLRLGPNLSNSSIWLGGSNFTDFSEARIQTNFGSLGIDARSGTNVYLNGNTNGDVILALGGGKVGIGTNTPAYKLDINSGNDVGIRIGPNVSYGESLLLGGWNSSDFSAPRIQTSNGNLHLDAKSGQNLYLNNYHNGPVLLALGGGRVGIGTAAPAAPLHVVGYAPVAGYLEWVTQANDSYNPGHWWWTEPVSILSENVVRAGALHIFSDARIKDIKKVSDGGADLATLMKIEVTDYGYKDVVARGNRPQKKVVAQQVEKIYPQAVSRSTDVVPDVFKKATVKDGWVELASDLKVGERVKLMSEKDQSVHEVLELRKGGFRTDWKEDTENLFVYGREVKDFRSVDYDAIAMLNVSATQQLAKQLKEKDAKIAALDASNAALVTSNAALDAKVAALGAKFAALEKLLSKAR